MEFSLLIGLVSGVGLIIYGILGSGSLMNFWDVGSVYITLGGTLAATIMSYPIGAFKEIPKHMKIIFSKNKYKPKDYIEKIVDYAQEARRKGLLALEHKAEQETDSFFRSCIMLIVDAIEPTKAREMLDNELGCLEERHQQGWQLYERMATFSPAFGMIGTLIGLINMLKGMGDLTSGDAASGLGAGMSVALVTTFYGSMLANMFFMPIANRLRAKHHQEMICKELIVEGVLAIHSGTNPRHIEERLKAFLAEKQRGTIGEEAPRKEKSNKKK